MRRWGSRSRGWGNLRRPCRISRRRYELDDDGSLHYQLASAYQASGNPRKAQAAMAQYQEMQKRNQEQKEEAAREAQIWPRNEDGSLCRDSGRDGRNGHRRLPIRFREVAASAGISFVLENSPTDRKHMIETMPGGIAVFRLRWRRPARYLLHQRRGDSVAREIGAEILEPPLSQRRRT